MLEVKIVDHDDVPADARILYSIIAATHNGKWLFVRHRDRESWEIPGGHMEEFETPDETARRELWEETGALSFDIEYMATYCVSDGKYKGFGRLYSADVFEMGPIPDGSEIAEVIESDELPANLTHPLIQPVLFGWIRG